MRGRGAASRRQLRRRRHAIECRAWRENPENVFFGGRRAVASSAAVIEAAHIRSAAATKPAYLVISAINDRQPQASALDEMQCEPIGVCETNVEIAGASASNHRSSIIDKQKKS